MIGINRAILNRWNARNLDSAVTGSIWKSHVREHTSPPYCEFEVLSDMQSVQTVASRYGKRTVQFRVWHTDDDELEELCQTVRNAFINADDAAANPMVSPSGDYDGIFLNVTCRQNPVIVQVTDRLWVGSMQFEIVYAEAGGLFPAR